VNQGSEFDRIQRAAEAARARTRIAPAIGIVLGSGLGALSDELTDATVIPYSEVPHCPVSTAPGHQGSLVIGELEGQPVAVLSGRAHLYEGYAAQTVAFPVRVVRALGAQVLIITNAAGCGAHLKSYAHLLEDRPNWADRAVALSSRVRDVSEYVQSIAGDETFGDLAMRVTYQDPCHLAHAQGIRAEPRALLSKVNGLELIEMAGAVVCCGSAGYYNLAQPEYVDRLLEPKIDAILATRPDAVVTGNPGCMLQLAAGLRSRGRTDIPVLHVVEVLDRALAAR